MAAFAMRPLKPLGLCELFERMRIGRELHDDVSQRLAALSIGLSNLRNRPGVRDEAEVHAIASLQGQATALVDGVRQLVGPDMGALVITHYQRILNYIQPDRVHVFVDGRIVESGGPELAHKLEAEGYDAFLPVAVAGGETR